MSKVAPCPKTVGDYALQRVRSIVKDYETV